MRRTLLSLLLACAVAIPVGCGGGDSGSKTTTNGTAATAYMRELAQTGATLQKTFGDISEHRHQKVRRPLLSRKQDGLSLWNSLKSL